jgi:hypothetical protein
MPDQDFAADVYMAFDRDGIEMRRLRSERPSRRSSMRPNRQLKKFSTKRPDINILNHQ